MGIIIPKKDVVVCYLLAENHFWLGERRTDPYLGKWIGVGGKIETGETPEEAQKRETLEEFRVDVQVSDLLKLGEFNLIRSDKPGLDRLLHVFVSYKWTGEPCATDAMIPHKVLFSELSSCSKKMLPGDDKLMSCIFAGQRVVGSIVRKNDEGALESMVIRKANGEF